MRTPAGRPCPLDVQPASILACLLALAACHPTNATPDPDAAGGSGDGKGGGDAPPASGNHAPVILEASTNTQMLVTAQTLSIQTVATDPDGIHDLIGGVVKSPGGATYGALATSAEEGAYQLDLTWARINQTESINIPPNQQRMRDFQIEVFDQAGASAMATVSTTLAGSVAGYAVCDGANVDPISPQHCGSCAFSCYDAFGSNYGGGLCIQDGGVFCKKVDWITLNAATGTTRCSEVCLQQAGAHVFSVNVSSCQVINGSAGCTFTDCNNASWATLPPGCVGQSLRCTCDGYWESPGF